MSLLISVIIDLNSAIDTLGEESISLMPENMPSRILVN
jgi:hypothetical protein